MIIRYRKLFYYRVKRVCRFQNEIIWGAGNMNDRYGLLKLNDIVTTYERIQPLINQTPIFQSALLNDWLGHTVLFKAECMQKIGAFKARGASNAILKRIENNERPSEIVASQTPNPKPQTPCIVFVYISLLMISS